VLLFANINRLSDKSPLEPFGGSRQSVICRMSVWKEILVCNHRWWNLAINDFSGKPKKRMATFFQRPGKVTHIWHGSKIAIRKLQNIGACSLHAIKPLEQVLVRFKLEQWRLETSVLTLDGGWMELCRIACEKNAEFFETSKATTHIWQRGKTKHLLLRSRPLPLEKAVFLRFRDACPNLLTVGYGIKIHRP